VNIVAENECETAREKEDEDVSFAKINE